MSKTLKIFLILVVIPVVLLVGAVIGLKLYFTTDRLKAIVIPRVEEVTQRSVSVADVSLSILPKLAIRMKDLAVSNPHGEKFEKEQFLRLDELILDVSIFPLLKNRLEVNEVVLTRPELYLEVNQEGVPNYAQSKTLTEQPLAAPEVDKEEPRRRPFTLLLSDFRVIDGSVEYFNLPSDRRITLQGYNQTVRVSTEEKGDNVYIEGQSSVQGMNYGSAKSFLLTGLPLITYQRLTYNMSRDVLIIDSVHIGVRDISLVLKGSVESVQTLPVADLTLRSARAELAQLLSLAPKEVLKAAEGLSSSGKFQFAMTIKGEMSDSVLPEVKGTFTVTEGTVRYAALPKAITDINIVGGFEQPRSVQPTPPRKGIQQKPGRFDVEKLTATLGSSTITGKFGVVNFDEPRMSASFNGSMNLAEVKEYYPLEQGTELTGLMNANLSLAGMAKDPMSVRAEGKLEFRGVTIKTPASERPLQNLSGAITFNNQVLESNQLAMTIGQSDMNMAFTMRNYLALVMGEAAASGKPSMLVTLRSRQFRTADLMSDENQTKGTPRPPKEGAKDRGALLPDIDVDANVSIEKLVTEKFEFSNARGSVRIRDGLITLQNFSLNAFDGTVVTRGTLDVRDMSRRPFNLDLDITGVEANALLPKFTSFGNNLFGKFSMSTSLKGDLNDTLGLDTRTLSGEGKVQVHQGRLTGYPLTIKLADYTGINELRQVDFQSWSNVYRIADGRIHIGELKIAAANTDFHINGSQGFDGTLDYRMLVRLPEALSGKLRIGGLGGELINFLKDKEGRLNLNLLVTGTAASPSFALDTREAEQAAKRALEQKARDELKRLEEEAKRKAEEELKKKAEEGLKKLFRKP